MRLPDDLDLGNGLDDIGSSSVYLCDTLTQVILFVSDSFDIT